MTKRIFPLAVATTLAVLSGASCRGRSDASSGVTIELSRCHLPAGRGMEAIVARCGTVEVWEDRAAQSGKKLPLRVAVVKATGRRASPDPLFFLAGGPGQSAIESYPLVASSFARMNLAHDIVLVDQRGTGGSGQLSCDRVEIEPTAESSDEISYRAARCVGDLQANVRAYTTANFVADLDEVRASLGYNKIDLYGASYGTRAALAYLRHHGDHVRAAILDGVVPPGWALGSTSGRDAQRAIDLVFARCAADEECNHAFPDLPSKVTRMLEAVASPRSIEVPHPVTAKKTSVQLSPATMSATLRGLLYASETASLLPLLVAQAANQEYAPLAAQSLLVQDLLHVSTGLHLAVACSEDAPFIDQARAARDNAGTFAGNRSARYYAEACGGWPRAEVPAEERAPVTSDAPVLLLSGEIDPVTPPSFAEDVAKTLPRSLALTVPGEGHGVLGRSCVARLAADFLERGDVKDLDAGCIQGKRPMRFFTSFAGPPP